MKLGLGESYDKVDVLPKKIRAYADITKPANTLGVMGASLIGSIFYFYYIGQPHLIADRFQTIIYVVVTLGFAQGASQAMNMAEDAEMDRQTPHKQNRPIPSGIITEEEARTLAWIMMLFALGRGYLVNEVFGVFVTIVVFMGIFYNLEPIRAKERIVSIPWQAVSRGLLSFPLIWSAYGGAFEPIAWVLGVFMFFYVLSFQNSADIIDREVDKEFGIKTFVVVFGVRDTVRIATASTGMMMITIGSAVLLDIVPERLLWLLLIIPFCIYMLFEMWVKPHKVSDRTGNHPTWLWFYVGMVLTVIIPTGVEIIWLHL